MEKSNGLRTRSVLKLAAKVIESYAFSLTQNANIISEILRQKNSPERYPLDSRLCTRGK